MVTNSFRKVSFMFLIAFFIMAIACNKNEDKPATKTELLMSAPWKLTAQVFHGDYDGDGVVDPVDTDMYADLDACDKDDLTTFKANGVGELNEGATKCDASDPQTQSFSWALKENETILNFEGLDFTIVELSGSTLKVSLTDPFEEGTTDKITVTFTH